jgi:hypothetical protein
VLEPAGHGKLLPASVCALISITAGLGCLTSLLCKQRAPTLQRDFITSLVNKANAILTFNLAQTQLLHDIGLISVETLTSGRLVRP